MCWWIANLDEEDQTKEAKMIFRSLSCMRMELCKARLATSQKLRAEWDRRLDNNSIAVDRIQENRELWLQAGGPDPDSLQAPTEILLAEAKRTVDVLSLILEKHGPGGRDQSRSFQLDPAGPLRRSRAKRAASPFELERGLHAASSSVARAAGE